MHGLRESRLSVRIDDCDVTQGRRISEAMPWPPSRICRARSIIVWRFRGSPHYIERQAARLGVSQVLADRARHNAEIHRVSVLLGQLCERYHRARKEDGKPVFFPLELSQVRGTLDQGEQELQKLHALAAASAEMLDEGWQAFGLASPERHFGVMCEFDEHQNDVHKTKSHGKPAKVTK
jgi:hypothetical protein